MDKNVVCFSILLAGALLSALAFFGLRLKKEIILSGFITGLVISLLNMLAEFAGAELEVYYVSGPWVLLRTPLPLTAGWVLLTFLFCLGYELEIRQRGRMAASLYVLIGIVVGCLTDYFFYRGPQILTLGKNGSPLIILTVWLLFIPLTVFLYEFFRGHFSTTEETG